MNQPTLFNLPPVTPDRDKWGTPPGVYRAPLSLLGVDRYCVDFAAGDGAAPVACLEHWDAARDSLRNPWDYDVPTLGWLNFPFSETNGGKEAWVAQALAQVDAHPVLLAFYGPATPDAAMVRLNWTRALLTRIEVTPRVHHIPPPGIEASSPNQVPHAIWLLGGPWVARAWMHPRLLVWDWRAEDWLTEGPLQLTHPKRHPSQITTWERIKQDWNPPLDPAPRPE